MGITMNIKVVLEPSEEGGYTIYVPSLPGCISEGETINVSDYQDFLEVTFVNCFIISHIPHQKHTTRVFLRSKVDYSPDYY